MRINYGRSVFMDYEEWLAAGNGARKDETLEESIGRTVDSMYSGLSPSDFSNRSSDFGNEKPDYETWLKREGRD
jgi:hypothetical protein